MEPGWPRGDRPPHKLLGEMWKAGRVMSCEMNEHPLGWEIRCYVGGDFHYSHVSPLRHLAEEEADAKKQQLIEGGRTGLRCRCESALPFASLPLPATYDVDCCATIEQNEC